MAKYCPYCASRVDQGDTCPYCNYASTYKAKPHHLKPGTLLRGKRYLVGRVLGEGGFGITYVGRDTTLDMKVAIKEYFPMAMAKRENTVSSTVSLVDMSFDSAFKNGREQFIEEAQTLADLDKESAVVTVRDFFGDNDSAYIVMEFVEGKDLRAIIKEKQKPVPAQELLTLLEPVFAALTKAHEKGLIHRDISPDNIMIENGKARLIDFGCARTLTNGAAAETMLKHSFSPIEQYDNANMGPWTDVYAMAATIYYCITMKLPPRAIDRGIRDELVPPSALGAKLSKKQERALMKALAVNPADRYQSMQEFGKDLFVHRNKYKYIAIGACAVAVAAAVLATAFGGRVKVETLAKANTVSEVYSVDDDLSAEEKETIRQVEDLIGSAKLSFEGTYCSLSVENRTDQSLDNVVFQLSFYGKTGDILGTTTGSVAEWKPQETASPRMYCGVSDPDQIKMRIYFNCNDKRYQTAAMPVDSFDHAGGITFTLRNELPESFPTSGSKAGEYTITSFNYTPSYSGTDYYVKFSLGGTYHGEDVSSSYYALQYKVVDGEGVIFDSGSISFPMLKDGDRFENAGFSVFNLKAGDYFVELLPRS